MLHLRYLQPLRSRFIARSTPSSAFSASHRTVVRLRTGVSRNHPRIGRNTLRCIEPRRAGGRRSNVSAFRTDCRKCGLTLRLSSSGGRTKHGRFSLLNLGSAKWQFELKSTALPPGCAGHAQGARPLFSNLMNRGSILALHFQEPPVGSQRDHCFNSGGIRRGATQRPPVA